MHPDLVVEMVTARLNGENLLYGDGYGYGYGDGDGDGYGSGYG